MRGPLDALSNWLLPAHIERKAKAVTDTITTSHQGFQPIAIHYNSCTYIQGKYNLRQSCIICMGVRYMLLIYDERGIIQFNHNILSYVTIMLQSRLH